MDSETLYRLSKIKQHQFGLSALIGAYPSVRYELSGFLLPEDEFGLYAAIYGVARYFCNYKTKLQRNILNAYDIIYVYSGKLHVELAENNFETIMPGEIFLLGNAKSYYIKCDDGIKTDFLLISHAGVVSDKFYKLICRNGVMKYSLSICNMIESLVENLAFYLKYFSQANYVLAVNTLSRILAEIYISTLNSEDYNSLGQPKWFIDALEYIEKNYKNKISILQISESVGLSSSHFHKLFREYTKTSPYSYIIKYRITNAKKLLLSKNNSVKYAAISVGFTSVNHFIEYFRKETGLTPAQYRDKYGY